MASTWLLWLTLTAAPAQDSIEVATESMTIWFSATGAVPIAWELTDPRYVDAPVLFIEPQAGIGPYGHPLEIVGHDAFNAARYQVTQTEEDGRHILRFESATDDVALVKVFQIPSRGLELDLTIEVENRGDVPLELESLGVRIGPGLGAMQHLESGLFANFYKYVWGVAGVDGSADTFAGIGVEDEPTFPDEDEALEWAGIHDRFFLLAIAPRDEDAHRGRVFLEQELAELEFVGEDDLEHLPVVEISAVVPALAPGDRRTLEYAVYAGPKLAEPLSAGQTDLSSVVFVGSWLPMRLLCHGIIGLLGLLQMIFRSWGIAIIGLALVIRMIVYPLYRISLKSQARTAAAMALMKPKFVDAKEKYKDDGLKRDEAILAIYKEHGVSPFGSLFGNLSLLIQIPIFIALFKAVGEAYVLQGASFLWIPDLSETEKLFAFGFNIPLLGGHFNLLPFLMAGTQIVSSALSSSPSADAKQALRQKLTMVGVGVAFFFLFYSFPAGLVLYWWMATFFASLQQHWITKRIAKHA